MLRFLSKASTRGDQNYQQAAIVTPILHSRLRWRLPAHSVAGDPLIRYNTPTRIAQELIVYTQ